MTTRVGDPVALELPITRSPQAQPADTIKMAADVKAILRFIAERWRIMLSKIGRFIWPLSRLFNTDVRSAGYGAQAFSVFTGAKRRFVAIGRGEVAISAPDRSLSRTV